MSNPSEDNAPPARAGSRQGNTLERIAAALEKQNALAEKAARNDNEDGGKKEGGDKGEQTKDDNDKKEEPGKAKKFFTSPLGILLTIAVIALLVFAGVRLWHYKKNHESTNDAYTTGRTHRISPRVQGLVLELWVDDNQPVRKGDLLAKLDPRDYEVALTRTVASLEQAQAQVVQAQGQLAQGEAAILQARSQVLQAHAQATQAAANFEVAEINFRRNSALFSRDARAVAQADVDTTKGSLGAQKAALEAARANAEASESNVKAAEATRDSRAGDLEAARANVDVARSNVDHATLQLSYCWVISPVAGRVSRRTVEVGQQLSAGQAIMSVTPNEVWVSANFKETQLERIRVGQRVEVPIDTFKHHPFTGRVDSIQNGSGATYALLPPDNATGNFTKIVQRVPVKIVFDRDDSPGSIKGFEDLVVPGLSCEPVVDLASTSDRGSHVAKDRPAPLKGNAER